VVINARREPELAETARAMAHLPGRVVVAPGDASRREVVGYLLTVCREEFSGTPDVCIVNAGRGLPGTVLTSDQDEWRPLFEENVVGVLVQIRAFANAMLGAGQPDSTHPRDIVVIGSSVGRNVTPTNTVYGASKFAVHGAVEGLRREVAPHNIRVSLIEPGIVRTNFQAAAGYSDDFLDSCDEQFGPLLDADDIARTIEFVIGQPPHVHINEVMLRPTRQDYP
jgi:NADP-dependent 3-hydroxy acid dehydrogenase YdfG